MAISVFEICAQAGFTTLVHNGLGLGEGQEPEVE